jgi:hypothetical protein
MAAADPQQKFSSAFPLPPPYYRQYKDLAAAPKPPPAPKSGFYFSFGDILPVSAVASRRSVRSAKRAHIPGLCSANRGQHTPGVSQKQNVAARAWLRRGRNPFFFFFFFFWC